MIISFYMYRNFCDVDLNQKKHCLVETGLWLCSSRPCFTYHNDLMVKRLNVSDRGKGCINNPFAYVCCKITEAYFPTTDPTYLFIACQGEENLLLALVVNCVSFSCVLCSYLSQAGQRTCGYVPLLECE